MLEHHVVVGVDGSVVATRALDAAAEESRRRAVTLEIVYGVPDLDVAGPVLTTSADRVLARHPQLPVRLTAVAADPATALLTRGRTAALVVVGTRALRAPASLASRSVAQSVAERSRCPLLVVGAGCPTGQLRAGEVLFAVESDADLEAAGFAFEEAVRRGARLRFVHTAHYRPSTADAPFSTARATGAECPAGMDDRDHDRIAPVPDSELITATSGADAVVVAYRRHGGKRSRRLRTVHALLHHARCPVLLVPSGLTPPGDGSGPVRADGRSGPSGP
ncbi:universal stress protein [Streptomyces sp. NBC_01716]|uniref:universal stress protein n=1 Tax=Streptomyces sp. NBC_01716 TaxID=2975917 RepID=UPI002E331FE3|nr:universal stress protein [Streptomyces sp. NBC_01716]